MAEVSKNKDKTRPGWMRIALFTSLAVNLLIVGLVGGALLRHDRQSLNDAHRAPLRELGYGPYGRALSASDRSEIGKAMIGRSGDLRANRAEFRAQITTLLGALRTQPFEPAVVQNIIVLQQEKLIERQEIGRQLLLDRINAMDDKERAAFANRLERSLRRGQAAGRP